MSDEDGTRAGNGRPSRRWFLAGGAAAVIGGGIGVGAGFLQPDSAPTPRPAPAELVDAVTAERMLLATAAAAARRDPSVRGAVATLAADHTAHLRALQSALAEYDPPRASRGTAPTGSPAPGSPAQDVRAQLRAAERSAAAAAAAAAGRLTGGTATLLASIAASESTHVEYLT